MRWLDPTSDTAFSLMAHWWSRTHSIQTWASMSASHPTNRERSSPARPRWHLMTNTTSRMRAPGRVGLVRWILEWGTMCGEYLWQERRLCYVRKAHSCIVFHRLYYILVKGKKKSSLLIMCLFNQMWITVQGNTVQGNTVQWITVPWNTVHYWQSLHHQLAPPLPNPGSCSYRGMWAWQRVNQHSWYVVHQAYPDQTLCGAGVMNLWWKDQGFRCSIEVNRKTWNHIHELKECKISDPLFLCAI